MKTTEGSKSAITKGKLYAESPEVVLNFQFNPEEIEEAFTTNIGTLQAPGRDPLYTFSGRGERALTFDLLFYGGETKDYLETLRKLITPEEKEGQFVYPTVFISFGGYITAKGFIRDVRMVSELFYTDLSPRMTRVSVTFVVLYDSQLY